MGVALLADWISGLTLQQQAVLVLALRGPDGFPKHHPSKEVLYRYRACVLKSAHFGRLLHDGEAVPTFMNRMSMCEPSWSDVLTEFKEVEDELPLHFYTHLLHGAQVLAYKYPDRGIRLCWLKFFEQCCHYLHCPLESEAEMDGRLSDFGRELSAVID